MDFTLSKYQQLLVALQQQGYQFITFEQYCDNLDRGEALPAHFIIMRHDVDLLPKNSLATARIEHQLGIRASYYFRVVPESNQPEYIQQIAALGHEIGYHYEDMAICQGDVAQAYAHFQQQLQYFRRFYPAPSACMAHLPASGMAKSCGSTMTITHWA